MLSGLILCEQDIDVHWIVFETPFFSAEKARKAARATGIPLIVRRITKTYMEMLRDPACGYGKNMNPCMDCHALMFRLAGDHMRRHQFDFLFSGEVLAQRPMSQTRSSLRYVEKNSGFDGFILRPLSAKKLPETIPEKRGWIDRERLWDISGRSRKRQMQLAEQFGITDYPTPGGGCLLTDPGYALRLRDMLQHQAVTTENELELLKYGRHFRISRHCKVIVGRTQAENMAIGRLADAEADIRLKVLGYPGPLSLVQGSCEHEDLPLAAKICASYSKAPSGVAVTVHHSTPSGEGTILTIPENPDTFHGMMIFQAG